MLNILNWTTLYETDDELVVRKSRIFDEVQVIVELTLKIKRIYTRNCILCHNVFQVVSDSVTFLHTS